MKAFYVMFLGLFLIGNFDIQSREKLKQENERITKLIINLSLKQQRKIAKSPSRPHHKPRKPKVCVLKKFNSYTVDYMNIHKDAIEWKPSHHRSDKSLDPELLRRIQDSADHVTDPHATNDINYLGTMSLKTASKKVEFLDGGLLSGDRSCSSTISISRPAVLKNVAFVHYFSFDTGRLLMAFTKRNRSWKYVASHKIPHKTNRK